MTPARVVPTLNPGKDRQACLGLCLPGAPGNQFTFQTRKEAFSHRVVIGIPHCPHGGPYAHFLASVDEAGVQSINVAYTNSNHVDAQGNQHRQIGSYTSADGQTRAATDVWVQTNPTYSVPTEWVDVPDDIALLPDAQGYGKVRDLHQAMAMDATGELKALVTAFTQATTPEDRDALVTQIIYRWTGVQDVDPASRAARMIYGNACKPRISTRRCSRPLHRCRFD